MRKNISCGLVRSINLGNKIQSSTNAKDITFQACRSISSHEVRTRRNALFTQEQKRQRENVGRVEKIQVQYKGTPEDITLSMNKNISTPYNCAQHMSEMVMQRSALALVNGTTVWDMHRPLESDCTLELLHFKIADPYTVNKAFWRTCSMVLGAVAERCFKPEVDVQLHSFPSPNVKSGSFVYDVALGLSSWQPTQAELRSISGEMVRLCRSALHLERLVVSSELAHDMFAHNKHKTAQIPDIAAQHDDTVVVYRCGDHIDISRGPMVGDTGCLGRCTVAAIHRLDSDQGNLYRFQGVALPKGFLLNHFAYGILEDRAKKLNPGRLPNGSTHNQPLTEAVAQ